MSLEPNAVGNKAGAASGVEGGAGAGAMNPANPGNPNPAGQSQSPAQPSAQQKPTSKQTPQQGSSQGGNQGGHAGGQSSGSPQPQSASPQAEGDIPLDKFLRMAVAQGVSDIHLRVGFPPMVRLDGDITRTKLPPVSIEAMEKCIRSIMPAVVLEKFKDQTDFDFSFALEGTARFRCNLLHELNQPGLVLRIIKLRIPTLHDLSMPSMLQRFTELPKGIVLVTGPTGSGKSTTLAAMLDTINHKLPKHIITLEDPIEYVYQSDQCVITQRQLGTDTDSFPAGIKYALRQDPDIILIGELRDRETISAALHAAETGHLVFSTLHTNDAVQTINRIINVFEPHERDSVRDQLADILQGTVAQRLLKRTDGKGRLAVSEIMLVTPAVRDYIRNNEIDEIYELIKSNDYDGMCSMNMSLLRAHKNGMVDVEECLKVSHNPTEFQQMLRGAFHGQGRAE